MILGYLNNSQYEIFGKLTTTIYIHIKYYNYYYYYYT